MTEGKGAVMGVTPWSPSELIPNIRMSPWKRDGSQPVAPRNGPATGAVAKAAGAGRQRSCRKQQQTLGRKTVGKEQNNQTNPCLQGKDLLLRAQATFERNQRQRPKLPGTASRRSASPRRGLPPGELGCTAQHSRYALALRSASNFRERWTRFYILNINKKRKQLTKWSPSDRTDADGAMDVPPGEAASSPPPE